MTSLSQVTLDSMARRLRHVESQLDDANRRVTDAHARAQASEWRARTCEAALETLKMQFSAMDSKRNQLAHALDTSLRQLGSAQTALRDKDDTLARLRRAPPVDEHPGLLQDLALLQLKLYGSTTPLLTCAGSSPSSFPH